MFDHLRKMVIRQFTINGETFEYIGCDIHPEFIMSDTNQLKYEERIASLVSIFNHSHLRDPNGNILYWECDYADIVY